MSNGFYKRRRGILEHLEAGTIGLLDLAIHDYLNLKANLQIGSDCSIPPGVCFTSAVAIHALCPKEISERTVRRSLEYLEKIGWIKRWLRPGKRGNYAVLICRAGVHDLSGVEYRINGVATTDWRHPVLIPAADCPQSGPDLSGYREVRIESREKRKGKTASTASLKEAWKVLGITCPIGNVMFQGDWESWWSEHGSSGKPTSQTVEDFLQYRQRRGEKTPGPFFDAKRRLEESEKTAKAPATSPIPVLEAEPWAN